MENINKVIEQHGTEIAEKLQIAMSEVYGKILWYIRLDGIIDLIEFLLLVLIAIFSHKKIQKYFSKGENETPNERENRILEMIMSYIVLSMVLIVFGCLIDAILENLFYKIIFPEFYIIHSLIEK